jgi:hypothetical protein
MVQTTLTKELVEAIINDKYIGATGFVWDGDKISFSYDNINFEDVDKRKLIETNMVLQQQVWYLRGRVEQSERQFMMALGDLQAKDEDDEEEEDTFNG